MAGPWSVPAPQGGDYTLQLVMGSRDPKPPRARRTMREGLAVLREGFDPIIDEATARDLAELMVLGRPTDGETFNFVNMTTVVLRLAGVPVVAAVVRVSGPVLAEIPLIATRRAARRRGHARVLLDGLAAWLSGLGVDQIMLPAHDDALDTWVSGFGFVRATAEELAFIRRHLVFVMFPATTVLKLPADASKRPPLPPRVRTATPAIASPEQGDAPAGEGAAPAVGASPTDSVPENERVRIMIQPARKQRKALSMPVSGRKQRGRRESDPDAAAALDGDVFPGLRPRRDSRRSYADVENGLYDFGDGDEVGANGRESTRGHRRSSGGADGIEHKSKSGRTVKRPRYADEVIDGVPRGPEQRKMRAVSSIFSRGLEQMSDSQPVAMEPTLPRGWRANGGVEEETQVVESATSR